MRCLNVSGAGGIASIGGRSVCSRVTGEKRVAWGRSVGYSGDRRGGGMSKRKISVRGAGVLVVLVWWIV